MNKSTDLYGWIVSVTAMFGSGDYKGLGGVGLII